MTSSTRTRRPAITASQSVIEAAANALIPIVDSPPRLDSTELKATRGWQGGNRSNTGGIARISNAASHDVAFNECIQNVEDGPRIPVTDARIVARSSRATLTTTTRSGAAPTPKRKEPTMDPQVSLWRAMAAGDPAAREQLLKEHLGLVHHVARQMSKTLAVKTDFDELVSSGSIGLMSALEAFDVDRGLAFSTFAAPRIRGAILDELRRQDHVPRSIRRKTREISQARETLGRVLGRMPNDREVADHLGVDMQTLWKWRSDVEGAHHVPLDRSPSETETLAPTPIEVLADEAHDSVDDVITREQEVHHLRDAILRLKEQERTVLSLYYFEELKLHEIADILQLTESRVSQIRSKALQKLRTELRPLREEVA